MTARTSNYLSVRPEWLASATEPALEPEVPIVDAHHHFYERPAWTYLLADYMEDLRSGHNIRASVYMQALTRYRAAGPDALRPVGEADFVTAATAAPQAGEPEVAKGIVGYADLRQGGAVRDVLEALVRSSTRILRRGFCMTGSDGMAYSTRAPD